MESQGLSGAEPSAEAETNEDEGSEESERRPIHRFKKGEPSANPNGRRGKGPIATQDDMRKRAQRFAPAALKALIDVARTAKDARARASAAQVVLAYAVGRPMTALEARAIAAAHSGPDPLLALHSLIQRIQPLAARFPELRVEINAVLASLEAAPDPSTTSTTAPLPAPRFDQDDESEDE